MAPKADPDNQLLTIVLSLQTDVTCHGGNNGLAVVAAIGGLPPYVFVWSNGSVGPIGANLSAGVYSVTCTDLLGGTANFNVTIDEPSAILVDVTAQVDINCLNANGSATVAASGGTGSPAYSWSNGSSGPTIANLNAGTYTVTVTDDNGCTTNHAVTIEADLQLPIVNINLNGDLQVDCGSPLVQIDATASSSGAEFSYLWTTVNGHIVSGANTLDNCVVDASGTYLLKVSNSNNGCTASAAVDVSLNLDLPVISVDLDGQLGCDNSPIVIDASASSQGSNFPCLWTTLNGNIVAGANTLTPTVNAAGTYQLLITNLLSGCTATVNVNITGSAVLNTVLGSLANVSCFGLADGSASLSVSGGIPPYACLWSNGQTSASVSGLTAGIYTAIITDAQGCQSTVNITITQPDVITASATTTPASGPNQSDGTAQITVAGGTAPYLFQWSNGFTGSSVSGLAPGTYAVSITDANSCQFTVIVVIGVQANCTLSINVSSQNATCNQAGSAAAQAINGNAPYSYLWSNGATGATVANLSAGIYTVTASDAQGCTAIGSAIILSAPDDSPPVVITQNVTLVLDNSGNATLDASLVNNGSFDACGNITLSLNTSAFNCIMLGTNIVVLTATDQSGNSASATATVTVVDNTVPTLQCPSDMTVNGCSAQVNYNDPVLQDNCTLPAYNLVLTGGFASGSIFPSGVTTVSFAALGGGGLGATCSFAITVNGGLSVGFDPVAPSCPGELDGSITALVSGGSGTYNYLWINAGGQTTATATGLGAGTYTVVVVDGSGCVAVQSIDLPGSNPLDIDVVVITDNCTGSGSLDVTVSGGAPPYSYEWFDANGDLFATTEDLDSIPSGDYTLVVTDANGCSFNSGVISVNFTTGVVEAELDSFGTISVSPNPSSGGFAALQMNLQHKGTVRVEMFNANGQQVGSTVESDVQYGQIPLDLSVLTPGHFLIKVSTSDRIFWKKLIVVN